MTRNKNTTSKWKVVFFINQEKQLIPLLFPPVLNLLLGRLQLNFYPGSFVSSPGNTKVEFSFPSFFSTLSGNTIGSLVVKSL